MLRGARNAPPARRVAARPFLTPLLPFLEGSIDVNATDENGYSLICSAVMLTNPAMVKAYGVDSMPETGENVAADYQISRADQDTFGLRSQQRAGAAQTRGFFAGEITPVTVPGGKTGPVVVGAT